ncbi:unnamed protein product, partial [Mesorhabditis belari]|uniref:Uncharacterized protein n=1 Tax=Mesorhabditis belari TaxID=2138241 RepID=A0AAF3FJH9_9BILA
MLLFFMLLLFISVSLASKYTFDVDAFRVKDFVHIACGQFDVCNANTRKNLMNTYNFVHDAISTTRWIKMNLTGSINTEKLRQNQQIWRDQFCKTVDPTAALLFVNQAVIETYEIACVSEGGSRVQFCALAPRKRPKDVYEYIEAKDWQRKVKQLRKAIDCSPDDIEIANQLPELHVCRKNCIHGGVSLSGLLMLLLLMFFSFSCIVYHFGRD